jgi:hypothetical protein
MGVPFYHFAVYAAQHILELELSGFFGYPGVQHYLQPEVTQLFAESGHIVILNSFHHLVAFLYQVRFEGIMRLTAVPWATARPAQALNYLAEGLKLAQLCVAKFICHFFHLSKYQSPAILQFAVIMIKEGQPHVRGWPKTQPVKA